MGYGLILEQLLHRLSRRLARPHAALQHGTGIGAGLDGQWQGCQTLREGRSVIPEAFALMDEDGPRRCDRAPVSVRPVGKEQPTIDADFECVQTLAARAGAAGKLSHDGMTVAWGAKGTADFVGQDRGQSTDAVVQHTGLQANDWRPICGFQGWDSIRNRDPNCNYNFKRGDAKSAEGRGGVL